MKLIQLTLLVSFLLVLSGCASSPSVGVQRHSGFIELPFPSNTYASGQIVEIFSSPRKVEITLDPQIPWDQVSQSSGWNISSEDTNVIRTNFATEISKILTTSAKHNSTQKVQVDFVDTRTRIVPKNIIFAAVGKAISEDPLLKKQLEIYANDGTQTLTATISFTVVDSNNQDVVVDTEVLKKLNSDFNIEFSREAGSNRVITGTDLVVGFHYDPKMIQLVSTVGFGA